MAHPVFISTFLDFLVGIQPITIIPWGFVGLQNFMGLRNPAVIFQLISCVQLFVIPDSSSQAPFVLHYLPEFARKSARWVSDAV